MFVRAPGADPIESTEPKPDPRGAVMLEALRAQGAEYPNEAVEADDSNFGWGDAFKLRAGRASSRATTEKRTSKKANGPHGRNMCADLPLVRWLLCWSGASECNCMGVVSSCCICQAKLLISIAVEYCGSSL